MKRVRVAVKASDPITEAGITSYLRSKAEFLVVAPEPPVEVDVLVVATEQVAAGGMAILRESADQYGAPTVLVSSDLNQADLLTAVECRVVAVLPRAAASGGQLVSSVLAAASGGGVMPPDLLGELLAHVQRVQRDVLAPHGLNAAGLTTRELDVLRLMADGWDTAEIASELCYSERTVKNVIHSMTSRLKLRNRPHAVAYALRAGMI